jgi:hypothetical protein
LRVLYTSDALRLLNGRQITLSVQRHSLPPPQVYIVVQKDILDIPGTDICDEGNVKMTLHGAYADRKDANEAAREVLRDACGVLVDKSSRIRCVYEESMDEMMRYNGCAYVGEAERSRVEVIVENMIVW